MLFIAKLVIAFVTTLSYPPCDDQPDTFGMDLACNLDDDCEIVIPADGQSFYNSRK